MKGLWEDINNWIEQYSGVTYDFEEDFVQLRDDEIFLNPTIWRNNLSVLLDTLSDLIDVIDEKWKEIPEELPPRNELKKYVTTEVLTEIIEIVNSIKQKLCIEPSTIRTFSTLEKHVDALYDLIKALSENSLEKLLKEEWFDQYEEDNKNFLTDVFQLSKNDLASMQFTINDILKSHEEE